MGDWQDMSEAWEAILSGAKHIGLRGPSSLAYIEELGVKNAVVTGDPVLYLGRDTVIAKPRTKSIGVNFGYSRDRLWGKSDVEFAKKLLGICELLIKEGYNLSFFSVWPKDTEFMRSALDDFLPEFKGEIFDAWKYSIDEAFAYFDSVDLFLGEKLHASISAACTHTPFIMFEYRPKCRDFMESIGEVNLNIKTDSVDTDCVMALVEDLYGDAPKYQERLKGKVDFYKGELEGFSAKVFGQVE
jgi:polysaccharide pyruvyl transferase WcaK-like protein